MNGSVRNPVHWEFIQPTVTCCGVCRIAHHLMAVIWHLDPANNPRYQPSPNQTIPGKTDTWCHRFVEEVLQAMAVFWPRLILVGSRWVEQDANGCIAWLRTSGASFGWRKCDVSAARLRANSGYPVVVTGPGHVAIAIPSPDPGPLLIAQAGGVCFVGRPVADGFGKLPVEFWTHD